MAIIIRRRGLGMSSAKGIAEFSKKGIQWIRNDKKLPEDDLYIRWGCTSNVPAKRVLNTAQAIHQVNDKTGFRKVLNDKGLCPETFFAMRDVPEDMLKAGVIVRPAKHAQGRNVHLCRTHQELVNATFHCKHGHYISRYVGKAEEYRVRS